jgi:flavorubredoxin
MTTTLTAPSAPTKTRLEPTRIASETFLIHDHAGEGHAPVLVPLNSMVIRSAEPVVVDTGMMENRDQYLADVFSIVEPEDIRWLFISHDDVDHTGNVNALMELAPNATLVINWFMQERMGASLAVSPLRQRWVGDNELIDVGDRTLLAIRPPIFDSPTTRGLFDPTTGVYWASDSFATPMPTPVRDVADLDPDFWDEGMTMFNQYVSPWLKLTDDAKYQATVDRIARLGATRMVGCHTPLIGRSHVGTAFDVTRRSPNATVAPQPDQAVLEQIQQMLGSAA